MEQIGVPFARFAARGVRNICLGPRAKNPVLRGDHIVIAIVNKDEWVVRELREEFLEPPSTSVDASSGECASRRSRLVDVDLTGKTTVVHEDATKILGDAKEWTKVLDTWSSQYGVQQ